MKKKIGTSKSVKKYDMGGEQDPKPMTMVQLKKKYPNADTTAAGDTRFQEYNAYAPKKFITQIRDTDAAFDKKYGKGKLPKNKVGGTVKKSTPKATGMNKVASKGNMMKKGGSIKKK